MSDQHTSFNLQDFISDAEGQLRSGLDHLTAIQSQAHSVFRKNPGTLITAVAIAGFLAGALLKQGKDKSGNARRILGADPFTIFVGGAIAGFLTGDRVLETPDSSARLYLAPELPPGVPTSVL